MELEQNAARIRAQGLGIAAISYDSVAATSEFSKRMRISFPLLSDAGLKLQRALQLPSFQLDDMTLLKRLVMVVDDGVIVRVFYPVFPPDRSAEEVIAWIQSGASS